MPVQPGEKFQEAVMERKQMEYLYFDGEFYVFMDNETFEQSNLTEAQLDGGQRFLKENKSLVSIIQRPPIK